MCFDLIVEFVAIVPEKFDAVVFVRIVRSGKNNAGIGPKRAGDISHARRWQRTDDENIDSKRSDSRDERVLKHVAGETSVFAEHDLRTRAFRECAWI